MSTWKRLLLGLAGVMLGGGGWWAIQAVLGSAPVLEESADVLLHTVGEGTVERSFPVMVDVQRGQSLVAINLLGGMVTRVSQFHGPVDTGTVVYEVDAVPVRVVEGSVPFYRELGPGLQGEDVGQLQAALVELAYLEIEPDGRFGASTARAVRAWRQDLGLAAGERVQLGELIAVEGLPRLLGVDDALQPGRLVGVGADALFVLSDEPVFEVALSEAQARAFDPEVQVVVEYDEGEWVAHIAESSSRPDRGLVVLTLAGLDGGPVCGEDCGLLSADRMQLRGRSVSVPRTTGPAVPLTAVQTDASGDAWVLLESGDRRQVFVVAAAGGVAVVEGLEVGEKVVVSGGPDNISDG